jgi:hypothetical protein
MVGSATSLSSKCRAARQRTPVGAVPPGQYDEHNVSNERPCGYLLHLACRTTPATPGSPVARSPPAHEPRGLIHTPRAAEPGTRTCRAERGSRVKAGRLQSSRGSSHIRRGRQPQRG